MRIGIRPVVTGLLLTFAVALASAAYADLPGKHPA
jgi:hypothetical protein